MTESGWDFVVGSLASFLFSPCFDSFAVALQQGDGKWGHAGGLAELGAPQGGRLASAQLQTHLGAPARTRGSQARAGDPTDALPSARAGEKAEQHQSDSGGKETI